MKNSSKLFCMILPFTYLTNFELKGQNIFPGTGPAGSGTNTPSHQLEVTQGDLNVAPFGGVNYGYRMGSGVNSPMYFGIMEILKTYSLVLLKTYTHPMRIRW